MKMKTENMAKLDDERERQRKKERERARVCERERGGISNGVPDHGSPQ